MGRYIAHSGTWSESVLNHIYCLTALLAPLLLSTEYLGLASVGGAQINKFLIPKPLHIFTTVPLPCRALFQIPQLLEWVLPWLLTSDVNNYATCFHLACQTLFTHFFLHWFHKYPIGNRLFESHKLRNFGGCAAEDGFRRESLGFKDGNPSQPSVFSLHHISCRHMASFQVSKILFRIIKTLSNIS